MSANPTTRRERKAATRAAVREAARRCLIDRGFHKACIADIAREADVAHGTFYVHFASKDAVLDDLLEEFNEALVACLAPVFAEAAKAPLTHTVRRIAETFLDHWQADAGFVRCYAGRSAGGVDLIDLRDGVNPPMAQALSAALHAAAASRGRKLARPDLAVQGLLALWLRVGLQHLFNDSVSRDDAAQTLVTLTVGAVRLLEVMRTGTPAVYFAGGEPTLRADLPALTRRARDLADLIVRPERIDVLDFDSVADLSGRLSAAVR